MELKQLTEKLLEKFNINNISELKNKLLNICLSNDVSIYDWYVDLIENDLETDYLQKIFQYYEADRKEKMQDYTPKSLSKLISELTKTENEKWIYDCCSGSGALTIQKWNTNTKLSFICEELDENVIPFLLFNIAVRNINAYVINKNILTNEVLKVYEVKPCSKYSIIKEIEQGYELPKCDTAISNPPYNIPFTTNDKNIYKFGVPPKSNANYGFIQMCLDRAENKSALILPAGVLSTNDKAEKEIRKELIENRLIECVIICPDKMFESTTISVCLVILNKNKTDESIEFVDMRHQYKEEVRLQNGQFGGTSHTKRTYEKMVKVFTDEHIKRILNNITQRKTIQGICRCVDIEDIRKNEYSLVPSKYIEMEVKKEEKRPYIDIIRDLNRVIRQRNLCKCTINESLAKSIGLDVDLYKKEKENSKTIAKSFRELLQSLGVSAEIEKSDYISFSKNKNEFKFENNSKEDLSHILIMIFEQWKTMTYFLNLEENRYLAELKDALLPDLMTGKIDVKNIMV
jgi:N-6 DNA methylase|nr:MAG TPA: N-6 DNA Methylase [Caudoviricetes sp.]